MQPDNFKEISKETAEKLKRSIANNNFVESFKVWQDGRHLYCLDGFHRCKALEQLENEGYKVPTLMPTVFLRCKNKKEAGKLVLIYSSIYAHVFDEGLYEHLHTYDLDFDELKLEIDLPNLDLDMFDKGWMKDEQPDEQDDEVPEPPKNPKSKRGEIYLLGKHRVMCGDATSKEDVDLLMDVKKADMVFTDPPYGMFLDTDFSSMKGSFGVGNKYDTVIGDNEDFNPQLITSVLEYFANCKEIFLWGADYYAELIPQRNRGAFIVWDKMQGAEGVNDDYDKMFGSNFELCWSKARHKRAIVRVLWKGIFGLSAEDVKQRIHPTQKPVLLVTWFLERFAKEDAMIWDGYLGSGSTLVACEKTGRICYGLEIEPIYVDVILNRYTDYTGDDPIRLSDNKPWSEVNDGGKTRKVGTA